MGNARQAPKIKYNGEKNRDISGSGKAIRTHDLERAIMNGLGDRDFTALKIMLYVTGNAEDWCVREQDILERCNMSKKAYLTSRQKLIDMDWLALKNINNEVVLLVNYNEIYAVLNKSEAISKASESEVGVQDQISASSEEIKNPILPWNF